MHITVPPHPPPPVPILSTFGISLPLPRGMESYILDFKKLLHFWFPSCSPQTPQSNTGHVQK